MNTADVIHVIGAGLAGCEAAWQAAEKGVKVLLYEMKPLKRSEAHKFDTYAELVCSNSLKSDIPGNASWLLKQEMRILNSLIIRCADKTKLPAGGALAVDREGFSEMVTHEIHSHSMISVINCEMDRIPDEGTTIIATGPLTSEAFVERISEITGLEHLYFFDAAAPLVTADSIDMSKAFRASRYGSGSSDGDYINCPLNREEYLRFYRELLLAETVPVRDFEKDRVFEGCMPVEVMAARGLDTLRFGPMKPVGLTDPKTGRWPYAAVQLRQDNAAMTLFNLVGFQTHLKWAEQKRVFCLIPGLENAVFSRYGVMHRNTYINSPELLGPDYRLKDGRGIYFAGQITGVEGYMESATSGLVAGLNAAYACMGRERLVFPPYTATGALAAYISTADLRNFQPMNMNFGIISRPPERFFTDKKAEEGSQRREFHKGGKRLEISAAALAGLEEYISDMAISSH